MIKKIAGKLTEGDAAHGTAEANEAGDSANGASLGNKSVGRIMTSVDQDFADRKRQD